jgi:hypothetical protein
VLDGVPVALIPPTGSPVALVRTPEAGVPKAGVTSVGDVPNTKAPEPVSPVTVAAKLALDGVAKNVATPVPRPLSPVAIGNPVAFVRVPEAGVPRAGVVKVGDVSVLLVSVCESVVPTIVPVGAATEDVKVVADPAIGI